MNTEKTAREWFEMLKEPYKSQAIKASEEWPDMDFRKELYHSLDDALLHDFRWDCNKAQNDWNEIHASIENGETTYLADANKDLQYWKKNAEGDYMTTPISVLRYISELEKVALAEPQKS